MDPTPDEFAPILLDLLLEMQRWVIRRVERIEFLDETAIARHVSIDFDLSFAACAGRLEEMAKSGKSILVPVGLQKKWPMTSFSILDSSSSPLAIMQKQRNGEFSFAALRHYAQRKLGDLQVFDERFSPGLRALVVGDATTANRQWRQLRQRIRQDEETKALLSPPTGFYLLANELTRNFLMLVALDSSNFKGIIKYQYVTPFPWRTIAPKRLAWTPYEFSPRVPNVGHATSYHAEVRAPEGLELRSLKLIAEDSPDEPIAAVVDVATRLHVNTSNQEPFLNYKLVLELRSPRRGVIRAAFVGSLFTFAVLLAGLVVQLMNGFIPRQDADAVAALLFSVPAVVLTVINRNASEHPVAERMLLGVRSLAGVYAGAALFATAGSVMNADGVEGVLIWSVSLSAAFVCLVLLRRSYKRASMKESSHRIADGVVLKPFDLDEGKHK